MNVSRSLNRSSPFITLAFIVCHLDAIPELAFYQGCSKQPVILFTSWPVCLQWIATAAFLSSFDVISVRCSARRVLSFRPICRMWVARQSPQETWLTPEFSNDGVGSLKEIRFDMVKNWIIANTATVFAEFRASFSDGRPKYGRGSYFFLFWFVWLVRGIRFS